MGLGMQVMSLLRVHFKRHSAAYSPGPERFPYRWMTELYTACTVQKHGKKHPEQHTIGSGYITYLVEDHVIHSKKSELVHCKKHWHTHKAHTLLKTMS